MKFKFIFIFFNIILLTTFLFIFLFPLMTLGVEFSQEFWAKTWFLPVLFIISMVFFNQYFIKHMKLYTLVEKQDWDALLDFLDKAVLEKRKLKPHYITLFANACIIKNRLDKIRILEEVLKETKPVFIEQNALIFGVPYLMKKDSAEMKEYYKQYLHLSGELGQWISWHFAFSLLLGKEEDLAKDELLVLRKTVKEPILKLLTLYLLEIYAVSDSELVSALADEKAAYQESMPRSVLESKIDKARQNMYIMILGKMLEDAVNWMYPHTETDMETSL